MVSKNFCSELNIKPGIFKGQKPVPSSLISNSSIVQQNYNLCSCSKRA